MQPLLHTQGFTMIKSNGQVFEHKWPSFEPDLDFMKTNILTKIHQNPMQNAASIANIKFSYDLTQWPSFWPQMTHFENDLDFI